MDIQKKEMAARLKSARETAHLSIEDAAEAAGVQPIAIRRWEKGSSLPSLTEFRALLEAYGVMACDILYAQNPFRLSAQEAAEMARAARSFSPALRSRIDVLLAMHATGVEPIWKTA